MAARRVCGGEAGYTILELLVAAALMAALTAATCSMLVDAKAMFDTAGERAGLHQAARVGMDRLTTAIGRAGAGADRGEYAAGLVRWMPPVWPGRTDRAARSDAITAISVLPDVPPAVLAFDVPAGAAVLDFERRAACALPCGFSDRMTLLVLDGRGNFDLFAVIETDGASATVVRLAGGTGASYARGAGVLPAEVRTYYWNSIRAELRVHDGHGGDFPVIDHVVGLAFEYFADSRPPVPLDTAQFTDGPWSGTGTDPFDADLLRIRGVRVVMRVEAASPWHRGADPRWFRNPGGARDARRLVKDVILEAAIAPRNLGGWR